MFSLESPHWGDSNENTQYTVFNIKKKITLNYPKSAGKEFFFLGTQERVRNSRGKRAISVRAIEVLLYQQSTRENFKEIYLNALTSFDQFCDIYFSIQFLLFQTVFEKKGQ